MTTKVDAIIQSYLKQNIPDIQPGDTVRVHQRVKEGEKERIQIFEGVVLARKHGKGINATITVRRVQKGYGVERVYPIHSPIIEKIEIVKRAKVRRAKLYYLRTAKGKKGRLKARAIGLEVQEPEPTPEPEPKPTEGEKKPSSESAPKETLTEQTTPEEEETKQEQKPVEEKPTEEKKE